MEQRFTRFRKAVRASRAYGLTASYLAQLGEVCAMLNWYRVVMQRCLLNPLIMGYRRLRDGNPLLYLFSRTWHYSKGNRATIVKFWFMFMAAESIDLFIQPLIFTTIMSTVEHQGVTDENLMSLYGFLALSLACTPAFWSLHGPARVMECNNAFQARASYRKALLQGIMTLSMGWHVENHSGDTIDKVEKGTSALYDFSEGSFEIIYAMFRFLGCYAWLAYLSRPSAYIVLVMVCVVAWITMRFDRVLIEQYQRLSRAENTVSEGVFDAISNITTVIILRVEMLVFKALVHKIDNPYELYQNNSRLNEWKWFVTSFCCRSTTVIVLGVYFWQHKGAAPGTLIGGLYLVLRNLEKVTDLFSSFTGLYGQVVQRRAKVMNAELLSKQFRQESFTNHVLPPHWQYLELRDLCFSYDGLGGELHLANIWLRLQRGKRYAFVGESGSGKTTLLKVVRDLCIPQTGSLLVDGVMVSEGFAGISRAIALIPQIPEIFATTIWENITLGAEYTMEFVLRFTDMACFTPVVEKLKHKFNAKTQEKGVNLSGGQQQRLALARGLLACFGKDIILLDEPTSSLDRLTELSVYQNIFREFRDKTIISTIHHLDLLPLFDEICVFDKGCLIASGTLSELLATCPLFQKMWLQRPSEEAASAN